MQLLNGNARNERAKNLGDNRIFTQQTGDFQLRQTKKRYSNGSLKKSIRRRGGVLTHGIPTRRLTEYPTLFGEEFYAKEFQSDRRQMRGSSSNRFDSIRRRGEVLTHGIPTCWLTECAPLAEEGCSRMESQPTNDANHISKERPESGSN